MVLMNLGLLNFRHLYTKLQLCFNFTDELKSNFEFSAQNSSCLRTYVGNYEFSKNSLYRIIKLILLIFSELKKVAMECPSIQILLSMFTIPSLIVMSEVLGREVVKEIKNFSKKYSEVLIKHLLNETEVSAEGGLIKSESRLDLALLGYEHEILQYKVNLEKILGKWSSIVLGQPLHSGVVNKVQYIKLQTLTAFEAFIVDLQEHAVKRRHLDDNKLATRICNVNSRITNITEKVIPEGLIALLNKGPNFVPHECIFHKSLQSNLESDIKKAVISVFRKYEGFYPRICQSSSLKETLMNMSSQVPSNSKLLSFLCNILQNYEGKHEQFMSGLLPGHLEKKYSIYGQDPFRHYSDNSR